jgi:ABC-type Fe3+-citrate transport system substrate-binding protein
MRIIIIYRRERSEQEINVRKKTISFVVIAGILLGTTGCSVMGRADSSDEKQAIGSEKRVQHVWGETVVQGIPRRIVALDFFVVDILSSLGVTPVGIAGADQTRVPAYLQGRVTSFTDVGERKEPNLEVIYSIQPDLIVANPERAKLIKQDLQQIAPTLALSDTSLDKILENVDLLGKLLGKEKEAQRVRDDLSKKMESAQVFVQHHPSLLVVGAFEDDYSVWIEDSFVGTLFSDIGMKYAFRDGKMNTEGKADIARISLERIAEINPDYLFVYGSSLQKMKKDPLFQRLQAVKSNHFLEVERDLWARGRGPIAAGLMLDQALPMLAGESKP